MSIPMFRSGVWLRSLYLLFLLTAFFNIVLSHPHAHNGLKSYDDEVLHGSGSKHKRATNEREVYIMAGITEELAEGQEDFIGVELQTDIPRYGLRRGEVLYPYHSWLFIRDDEDLTDHTDRGSLRIEIDVNKTLSPSNQGLYLRFFDWTPRLREVADQKCLGPDITSRIGYTKLTNSQLMDPQTGKGIVADVMHANPNYKQGKRFINDHNNCHDFVFHLAAALGIDPDSNEDVERWRKEVHVWNGVYEEADYDVPMTKMAYLTATEDKDHPQRQIFDMQDVCPRAADTGPYCVTPEGAKQIVTCNYDTLGETGPLSKPLACAVAANSHRSVTMSPHHRVTAFPRP